MVALYDIASFGIDYPFTRELIKMWQHLNFNFIEMLIWYNFLIYVSTGYYLNYSLLFVTVRYFPRYAYSPSYETKLLVSRTGPQVSRIKSAFKISRGWHLSFPHDILKKDSEVAFLLAKLFFGFRQSRLFGFSC